MTTTARPAERQLETEILGRDVTFDYSETWVGYSVLGLRLIMAWVFLQAGIEKLLDPEWTAQGFLLHGVPEGNPFAELWPMLADLPLIDPLVMWGQILVGLALLVGVLVRFAAFWGAIMMLLFWAAALEGGLAAGLPVAHGYVVDSTLVYAGLLFGLGAVGAGRILGLDDRLEDTEIVRRNPWLRYLLG